MVCFVVYPRKSQFNHAFEWMRERALLFGVELVLRFDDECFSEDWLPDCVLMRGYNFELSLWFESRGVRVVNNGESMAIALDKWRSHAAFLQYGLASPKTLLIDDKVDYNMAASMIGSDLFVVKGVCGEKGEKVWLVCNAAEYCEAIESCGSSFIVQQFVEESAGRDIRVWVVGDRAVCAVIRENKNSFKSNISAGGSAVKFDLTQEISSLAVAATKAVGLEIAGVDILIGGKRGYMLCEINGNAGFRSAAQTNQGDIVEQIMRYVSLL